MSRKVDPITTTVSAGGAISASSSTSASAGPSMPTSPTFGEYDAPWKLALRDRIMKDLETMLQNTTEAYQRKIADNGSAPLELLYQFQREFNLEVLKLQTSADEEVRHAIAREQFERQWEKENGVSIRRYSGLGDPTQALVEERLAMLSFKTKSEFDHQYDYAETTSTASFARERELSLEARLRADEALYATANNSYPSTAPTSISSQQSSPNPYTERSMSNAEYTEYHALQSQSKASAEARAKAEKQQQQQDVFRRRAEEILRRKRQKKLAEASNASTGGTTTAPAPEAISASSSLSSTTSSAASSSSEEDQAPSEVVFKAENPMSPQDVTNLMTYHDQQWTWMLTVPSVTWVDFPWPLLSFSSPRRVEDLTLEAIAEYIFAPLHIHNDRKLVQERLKDLRRRWDPVRFGARYLGRVRDADERMMVKDGAGVVARVLADLAGKWSEL